MLPPVCTKRPARVRVGRGLVAAAVFLALLSTGLGGQDAADEAAGGPRAAIITIEDEINDITLVSMSRRIDQAREDGVTLIVLELDTPGGLASSALDICVYLKNLTDLKTVAWVRPSAYSAGSMIALACDEVVMASASQMGDCAPIIVSPTDGLQQLGKTERAKAESPILKQFRDSANRRGYDPLLCESMVRLGNEIWWLENGPGGERKFVLKAEKERLLEAEGATWQPVATIDDPVTGRTIDLPQPVVGENDLLTLTQTEAVVFGFAKAIVSSESELRDYYGLTGEIVRVVPNWAEALADFLSSPIVRMVLMTLIALGAYAEFQAPGHFVGGAVAVIALLIFLGAPYLTGLADVWEILLIILGVILLGVEVFIIPGFGVAGFMGLVLVFIGFIATFVPAEPGPLIIPRMPATWLGLKTGFKMTFGSMGMAMVGMWLLNRYLPAIPGVRGLILSAASQGAGGAEAFATIPTPEVVRMGDAGRTLTTLRPSGKAKINGRRVDVIAQGTVVEAEREVEVVEVSGGRVVVREIPRA